MDPEVERDGLTSSQLQTDVELRLTQSGIKVGPSSMGFLYVNVYAWKPEVPSLYAYSLRAEFNQGFMLNRNPKIYSLAATWSVSAGGTVGTARVSDIRSAVTDLVDRFINAYFEQNPKR